MKERVLVHRLVHEFGNEPSLAHDEHAVSETEDLLVLGRDEQDGRTVSGQGANQLVDGSLGPDIYAAGRLVRDETRGGRNSNRANSTFCWLPPESVLTRAPGPVARTSTRSISVRADLRVRRSETSPA